MFEVQDWNDLVKTVYNKPYHFQQQDGCKQRGTFKFSVPLEDDPSDFEETENSMVVNGDDMGVSFKTWLETDPTLPVKHDTYGRGIEETNEQSDKDFVWERNFYPCVDMIIEDLASKGFLEDGDYMINVDW